MKTHVLTTTLLTLVLLTSCSTMRKSIGFGATSGALTGLAISSSSGRNNLQGAAIGAAVGSLASYFIHKGLESRDAKTRKETLFNLDKFGVYQGARRTKVQSSMPFSISSPSVEQEYIETHVQDGKRLIEGHRIWTISEEPQWIPSKKTGRN